MLKQAVLLAVLTMSATAFALQPSTDMQFGAIKLSNTSQKKIYHSGMLQLDHVKVEDSATINGYLLASHSQFKELTINGHCQLDNTELLGPLSINGQLQLKNVNANAPVTVYGFLGARKVIFEKQLNVTSENTDLIDTSTQNINIEGTQGEKQTVNLTRTKVNGDIVFSSGTGIVRMDPESSIKGKVTGGMIEKVTSKPRTEEKNN